MIKILEVQLLQSFLGGDFKKIPYINLLPNQVVGDPVDITDWKSSINKDNYTLTRLSSSDVIPIYDLIIDPTKKEQLREAVRVYIEKKQIEQKKTAPIIQVNDGKNYRYFTSVKDYKNSNLSSTPCHVVGSIALEQYPGTVPLYFFTNCKSDRFSLEEKLTNKPEGYVSKGIVGYVQKDSSKTILYELSNGVDFAYTLDYKNSYGEKNSWKRTGVEIYTVDKLR